MPEDEIADVLNMMAESIRLIRERFSRIKTSNDFVLSSEGVILLDAICMRLQVIGESVKKIQKINPSFLQHYDEIEWDKIAKFRDFVSHQYNHVDHEVVYDICKVHIPKLSHALKKIQP